VLLDVVEKRRSGRSFDPKKPVSKDMIQAILEAGRLAPSCANTQAWNFLAITDPNVRENANEAMSGGNYWAARAPVMVIVAFKQGSGCGAHKLPYEMMDIGLAVENMLLQAVHMGLLSHPTAGWKEELMKEVLGIPEEYRIGAVVFFGYEYEGEPDFLSEKHQKTEKAGRKRRPFEEVVHWNKW
jgi:nitroreductase